MFFGLPMKPELNLSCTIMGVIPEINFKFELYWKIFENGKFKLFIS
jgi:hypothetical protein